jgi:DNA modification methylase
VWGNIGGQMTPYYDRDGITIYCGECSDVMGRCITDGEIDLTVTSPPYDNLRDYNGYTFPFDDIARQLWRVTKSGGVVVWVVADATINGSETGTSFRQALRFKEIGFNLHDTMIYKAAGTGAKGSNLSYWQGFEFMFVLSSGRPNTVNRIRDVKNKTIGMLRGGRSYKEEKFHYTCEFGFRSNIWEYRVGFMDNSDKTPHPAPFPEALARDHIISWSNPGDVVFDPMCGSGTTLKMAQQEGRRAIGIELSEDYCKIAVERLRQRSLFAVETAK